LEGFTESLRHELAEFGVKVILIEPGGVKTNFVDNIKTAKNYNANDSPYAKSMQKIFEGLEPIMADASHPSEVAQVILNAINSNDPDVRYTVGKDAESVIRVRSELTDKELEKWVQESYMGKKGFVRTST
jgi:NAD(P)-dependent dehydrogenase (short-subunit alcohol dehydrogenase family)